MKNGNGPNGLYPVVQDLSEAEFGGGSLCDETFGSFQVSDLVLPVTVPSATIWNALCDDPKSPRVLDAPRKITSSGRKNKKNRPITNNGDIGDDATKTAITELEVYHNSIRTPVKPATLSQRDSSDSFPVSTAVGRDDPQIVKPTVDGDAPCKSRQEGDGQNDHEENENIEVILAPFCTTNKEEHQRQEQSRSGRKHLRRKSKQLLNMLMAMSPASTSNRDLSAGDTMADSSHMQCAVDDVEQRCFDDSYVLVRQVSCLY